MSDTKKPSAIDGTEVRNEGSPAQVAVDANLVNVLLEQNKLLQEDAIERAEERRVKRENENRKREARKRSAGDLEKDIAHKIRLCDHLKGNPKTRAYGSKPDYNLTHHIFLDSSERIACGSCPLKLWGPREGGNVPADSKEFQWINRGKGFERIPNPSGLSFADAKALATKQSTNTTTMSERVLDNPFAKANEADQALQAKDAEIERLKAELASKK